MQGMWALRQNLAACPQCWDFTSGRQGEPAYITVMGRADITSIPGRQRLPR